MKIKIILTSAIATLFFLAGCEKKTPDKDVQLMLDVAKATEAVNKAMTGGNPGASSPIAEVPKPPQKKSGADLDTPLENYVVFAEDNKEPEFIYLYAALGGKPLTSDEDFVGSILRASSTAKSLPYRLERDAFKRREIEAAERPRIKAEIERYRQIRYIAIETSQWDIARYDFAKKGFSVLTTFQNCANQEFSGGGGIVIKGFNEPGICLGFDRFLVVQDEAVAKSVEALRVQRNYVVRPFIYAYVEAVGDGEVLITPTAIRLQFFKDSDSLSSNQAQPKPVADLIRRK